MNCGGESHVDILGIRYAKDSNQVGTASDFGKQLIISRVPQQDQILYQTERYHASTFGYDIPVTANGHYLLVLKFSEVYFTSPNMKVRLCVRHKSVWPSLINCKCRISFKSEIPNYLLLCRLKTKLNIFSIFNAFLTLLCTYKLASQTVTSLIDDP